MQCTLQHLRNAGKRSGGREEEWCGDGAVETMDEGAGGGSVAAMMMMMMMISRGGGGAQANVDVLRAIEESFGCSQMRTLNITFH